MRSPDPGRTPAARPSSNCPAASISVIIPAFNRATVIARAIGSATRQTLAPLEVIVVDDHSSDDTCAVVEAMAAEDPRVRLIRLDRNRGGATARNAGAKAARGELLAFLDSDDEWTESHLERGARLLGESAAGLVFGSFHLDDGRRLIERRCRKFEGDPLEYLFLARGGFRTSTFVCEKEKFLAVMFDDRLHKHQDWDLMINFRRRFPVAVDTQPTAILHIDRPDRISSTLNHQATEAFVRKNLRHCHRNGWILFATFMMDWTFREAGEGPDFRRYLDFVRELDAGAFRAIRSLTPVLRVPRIGGRLFRAACRRYCVAAARRRPGLLEPGAAS